MQAATARQSSVEYLGALLEDERRLVLVPVTLDDPWAAFKQLRSFMKKSGPVSEVALFESETPIEQTAKVIPLEAARRRRA